MKSFLPIDAAELIFLADSHFRDRRLPGEAKRRERFKRFLAGIPPAAVVFLLGDIFDFYFEYRSVVCNRYFDLFHALYDCRRRGVELHFLGGNHDFWANGFLRSEIGIMLHQNEIRVESQGRKILCVHGDLVMPDDRGYKALKSVIRNRLVISIAKIIPADLLDRIAGGVSTGTPKMGPEERAAMADRLAGIAEASFYTDGNDVFIMGHVHHPLHRSLGGKDFMIVGDWIDHYTFGRLRKGKLSLEHFTD